MQLVEKHIIKHNSEMFAEVDKLCFLSKNLYNAANYIIRQEFINNQKYLNYNHMDKLLNRESIDYKHLPAKVSQQVLKILHNNWISFFHAIKDYNENPQKYEKVPKIPKYKKKNGRNILVYTKQALSQTKLRQKLVCPSKTNIRIKTKIPMEQINQVRIIPQNKAYKIEIVYSVDEPVIRNNNKHVSIDIGINNLMTVVNDFNSEKLIINGKPLKSINQYYNKKKAKLMSYVKTRGTSNKIVKLTNKRNNKVNHYLHCCSKNIINYCLTNDVGNIIIGHSKEWKQNINLGKQTNQNFVSIPFCQLITQIQYKAKLHGINTIIQEESYTSKCSFVDDEELCHHDKYIGKRITRGMFKTNNLRYNADVNGALNIMRKAIPTFSIRDYGIEGVVVHPTRVTPCKVKI